MAPEDIHVYSIDEVFMDVTDYLEVYKMSAHDLAMKIIRDVLDETGITATAGIGTNLYIAKIAMDIVAKMYKSSPHHRAKYTHAPSSPLLTQVHHDKGELVQELQSS